MKNMNPLKAEIVNDKLKLKLLTERPCTLEENKKYAEMQENNIPLPENVAKYDTVYSTDDAYCVISEAELTPEEKAEYVEIKRLRYLKTIKNCLVYFTTLSVISLAMSILYIIIMLTDYFL